MIDGKWSDTTGRTLGEGITKDLESFVRGMITRRHHAECSITEMKNAIARIRESLTKSIEAGNALILSSDFVVEDFKDCLDEMNSLLDTQISMKARIRLKEHQICEYNLVIDTLTHEFNLLRM